MAQTYVYLTKAQKIKYGIIVIFSLIIVLIIFTSVKTINAGEVGIKLRFGEVVGTLQPGLSFIVPFAERVEVIEARVQKEQVPADSASKDLQQITVQGALNYSINREKAGELYRTVGLDYRERIIAPAIQENVKAATAQYTAEELITRRAEVKDKILNNLRDKLKVNYIIVEDFSIVDFGFSAEFNRAIESKQTAQQNAQKAQNDLERIKIEGEQSVTKARADAEAQKLQIQSLTSEFLQKLWIEKWDGKLPQVSGTNTSIINLSDLIKK